MKSMKQLYPKKCDLLVWELSSAAHKLLRMTPELKEYYPELIPFLEIIVTNYPAIQESHVKKDQK